MSAAGETERVAAAVRGLVGGVADEHLRSQLHAIAVLVEHLEPGAVGTVPQSPALAREIDAAMEAGDEAAAIAAARRLAAAERATVGPADWAAISGG